MSKRSPYIFLRYAVIILPPGGQGKVHRSSGDPILLRGSSLHPLTGSGEDAGITLINQNLRSSYSRLITARPAIKRQIRLASCLRAIRFNYDQSRESQPPGGVRHRRRVKPGNGVIRDCQSGQISPESQPRIFDRTARRIRINR